MELEYKEILNAWESQKPQGRSGGKTFWLMIRTAIEKQIPVKPAVIPTTKDVPTTHNLGRLLHFHCPKCGNELYSGQKFCDECGKAIADEFE